MGVTNRPGSLVLVVDMISAAVMTAAALTLLGHEEALSLNIRKDSADKVEVNVAGGPGLHRLETGATPMGWPFTKRLTAETEA